mmetsp:Transcript_120813/g.385722  ORF Transcript_120813/g.385722 Transcript_120813/m.385722 type:complete len:868 (+) Transcript_120813:1-2604(+)
MSIMFNGTSLWLAMHASQRAQCAATSLLTRNVRLPIPSMGQLDNARVIASSFEKQPARDMFRVPFMRHPESAPDMPHAEDPAGKTKSGSKKKHTHDPQKEFGSTHRDSIPSWLRDEVIVDKGEGFVGEGGESLHDPQEAPDHFKLLMKAQESWRDYDVYARICMLYGVVSYLYAVCYYAVGTAMVELRGFWVMWSIPMIFMGAQCLIMRLDILRTGSHRLPNLQFLGHMAPYIAVSALTLEYRYYYSEAQQAVAWGLALLAIFAHFAMALRMLDLAWPEDAKPDMPEEPGRQWWPGSWRVPGAFTKHLWFLTPPKKLEAGQHCVLHEMEDMARHGGGIAYRRKQKSAASPACAALESVDDATGGLLNSSNTRFGDFKRGNDLPWHITRVVIITAALQWFFLMITTSVEIILGPDSLMKPPGEPPWIRDTKYRHFGPTTGLHLSGTALPENYRLFFASKVHSTAATSTAHGTDTYLEHDAAAHAPAAGEDYSLDTSAEHAAAVHASAAGEEHSPDTSEENATDAHAPATAEDHARDTSEEGAAEAHATATAEDHAPTAGAHRRLANTNKSQDSALLEELLKALPTLADLADMVKGESYHASGDKAVLPVPQAAPQGSFMAAAPKVKRVSWPALFEPQHLLLSPTSSRAIALTRRGFGALVRDIEGEDEAVAEPFALEGLEEVAAFAGAAWTKRGLQLLTTAGKLVLCPGETHVGGSWVCRPSEHPSVPMPTEARIMAAAIVDADDHEGPHVALVFEHFPATAFVYRSTGGAWHPAGEVHIPPSARSKPTLAFDGPNALLISTATGDVHRRALHGSRHTMHPAPASDSSREFRAACAAPGARGQLVRLALKKVAGAEGSFWSPELLLAQ